MINSQSLQSTPAKPFRAGYQFGASPILCLPEGGTPPLPSPQVGFMTPRAAAPPFGAQAREPFSPCPFSGPDYKGLPPGFIPALGWFNLFLNIWERDRELVK